MGEPRRTLEGLVVPDTYPAVPQPADIVRVAPDVVAAVGRPWRRIAWAAVVLLGLVAGGVVWVALEVRASRAADAELRAERMREALDAEQRR